jgi:hypothetical protein
MSTLLVGCVVLLPAQTEKKKDFSFMDEIQQKKKKKAKQAMS